MGQVFQRADLLEHHYLAQDVIQDKDIAKNVMELGLTTERIKHAPNAQLVKL
jgi:hypothetical protein